MESAASWPCPDTLRPQPRVDHQIAFFATSPTTMIMPIIEKMLIVCVAYGQRVS